MARISTFRQLEVWNLSMEQTTAVYRLTEGFPRAEQFGVVLCQFRRTLLKVTIGGHVAPI
jgi:hypothetical protein